jgi:hypothetical protein
MIKYFNYILIFIIVIHLLQFLYYTYEDFTKETFGDVIWNYPTRINNYVYDIRGYPDQYCLKNIDDKEIVVPCFYENNSKYDVNGKYIKDDNDKELEIQPYIKNYNY